MKTITTIYSELESLATDLRDALALQILDSGYTASEIELANEFYLDKIFKNFSVEQKVLEHIDTEEQGEPLTVIARNLEELTPAEISTFTTIESEFMHEPVEQIVLNYTNRTVTVDSVPVKLTPKQLGYLLERL